MSTPAETVALMAEHKAIERQPQVESICEEFRAHIALTRAAQYKPATEAAKIVELEKARDAALDPVIEATTTGDRQTAELRQQQARICAEARGVETKPTGFMTTADEQAAMRRELRTQQNLSRALLEIGAVRHALDVATIVNLTESDLLSESPDRARPVAIAALARLDELATAERQRHPNGLPSGVTPEAERAARDIRDRLANFDREHPLPAEKLRQLETAIAARQRHLAMSIDRTLAAYGVERDSPEARARRENSRIAAASAGAPVR